MGGGRESLKQKATPAQGKHKILRTCMRLESPLDFPCIREPYHHPPVAQIINSGISFIFSLFSYSIGSIINSGHPNSFISLYSHTCSSGLDHLHLLPSLLQSVLTSSLAPRLPLPRSFFRLLK